MTRPTPGSLLRASATLVARGLETPVTSTTRSMATRSLPGDKNNPGLHRRGGPGGDRGPTVPVDEAAAAACEAQPRLVQKISYARSKIRSRTKQYLRVRGVTARDAPGAGHKVSMATSRFLWLLAFRRLSR